MEDDLHFFEMIDNLFFVNRRFKEIIKKIMQPETLQIKTMVVAPLRVIRVICLASPLQIE